MSTKKSPFECAIICATHMKKLKDDIVKKRGFLTVVRIELELLLKDDYSFGIHMNGEKIGEITKKGEVLFKFAYKYEDPTVKGTNEEIIKQIVFDSITDYFN